VRRDVSTASFRACGQHVGPAAVASTNAKPSATASPVTVNYGQQYLSDVAAFNAAATAVGADPNATMTSPDVVSVGTDATTVAKSLLTQTWPASAQADIKVLARDAERVNVDIQEQGYQRAHHGH
jgi:hypothetical protein